MHLSWTLHAVYLCCLPFSGFLFLRLMSSLTFIILSLSFTDDPNLTVKIPEQSALSTWRSQLLLFFSRPPGRYFQRLSEAVYKTDIYIYTYRYFWWHLTVRKQLLSWKRNDEKREDRKFDLILKDVFVPCLFEPDWTRCTAVTTKLGDRRKWEIIKKYVYYLGYETLSHRF